MKISFYTNNTYFQNYNKNNPAFGIKIPELETAIDTFISKTDNALKEEQNLIQLIIKFAKKIFQPENFIGSGSKNKVYDMGKYVFRIPNETSEQSLNLSGRISKNSNLLNIDSYYGETLLQIGDIKILKNIGKHTSCGVPYSFIRNMTKEEVYNYYFEKYFLKASQLPQSSFDKFAQDVKKIKYPNTIDFQNPNNTAITKDNKIVLTDDLLKYNKYCGENSTAKLLRIFMLDAGLNIYTPVFEKYLNEARTLFKKIILAGEKAGLTFSGGYEDNLLISDALSKCKAKVKSEDFIKKIADIRQNRNSESDGLKELECYIDR